MEGLAVPFEAITTGISNIFSGIGNILNYLNPFSDKFILKGVLDFLSNILSYINPFSDNFLLKGVLSFLSDMLSYINPFSDNFLGKKIISLLGDLLQYLFIPKEDHFTEIKTIIDEKFGFINQIKELAYSLFNVATTADDNTKIPPSFNITYKGVTVKIVDFSVIEPFRNTFHAIISAVLWVSYILRTFRRLPGIIGGFYVENDDGSIK